MTQGTQTRRMARGMAPGASAWRHQHERGERRMRHMVSEQQTVLVVDDEDGIVELMRDFLEVDGFAVRSARNGAEALAALADTSVDCVLLDIMMPGVTGFDLLKSIREMTEVPVLFLSAREGASDKIRGLRLGADDYVVKSATPDEVVARVHAVLRRYHFGSQPLQSADDGVLDFGRL